MSVLHQFEALSGFAGQSPQKPCKLVLELLLPDCVAVVKNMVKLGDVRRESHLDLTLRKLC